MVLKVNRAWKKAGYTIGKFFVNGIRLCESLEDTDRGLNMGMSEALIKMTKIAGQTAIPTGTYTVVLSASPKFKNKSWAKKYGGLVPEIVGVPGYSGVRIHPLTDATQTDGCVGVGDNKVVGKLVNSQKRYFELMDKYLIPAWSRKEQIKIMIK